MTAVRLPPQLTFSAKQDAVAHCMDDEDFPETPVILRPRSQAGPADLAADTLAEASVSDAPKGAEAATGSQGLAEASHSDDGEDSEDGVLITSVRTRDFFEDTPMGAISVRTLDPFDDTPAREASSQRFGHGIRFAMPAQLPQQQQQQPAAGEEEAPPQARGASEPAGAKLGQRAAARIKVRNTFVHFSDDEEEVSPGKCLNRRARTTRTVPARILEGAHLQEESDQDHGHSASSPDSASPQAREGQEGLPTLLQQPQHQHQQHFPAVDAYKSARCDEAVPSPGPLAASIAAEAAAAAKAAAAAAAAVAAAAASASPAREQGPAGAAEESSRPGKAARAMASAAGPMYVEQAPSALEASPRRSSRQGKQAELQRPRFAEQAESAGRGLRLTVRNTFVDIEEDVEGGEQSLACHRRGDRRSKTGPPGMCLLEEDASDDSEEVDGRSAGAAARPCKVSMAQERPEEVPQTGPAVAMANCMTMPAGMCMPLPMPMGMLPPFFSDINALAPFFAAQVSAAQAMQPSRPAAPHAAPPPPAAGAAAEASAAAAFSKRAPADRTTVVLQNLPLNYRRAMLLRMLDAEGFAGEYDFAYLPMDFKTRAGFGYAFINLVDPSVVLRFWQAFDGYKKWMFPSAKICRVSWSVPHQGLKAHIKRYRNSPLMHETVPDEYRPVLLSGGQRVSFPPPTKDLAAPNQKVLAKAPKGGRRQSNA